MSRAREQAIRQGFPYFILITSTPNRSYGTGEWFYKRWTGACDSDKLFDPETNYWKSDDTVIDNLVLNSNRFVKVQYHWSEDPTKDQAWYEQQVKELDDIELVGQELNLDFVSAPACIFSSNMLKSMRASVTKNNKFINLRHGGSLEVFR